MKRPAHRETLVRSYVAVVATFLLLLAAALPAAQSATASLTGMVSDEAGDVIVGANVTITSDIAGAARTMKTDSQGAYEFTGLLPGIYALTITSRGFKPFETKGSTLLAGRVVRADVILRAGKPEIEDDFGLSPRIVQPTEVELTELSPPVYPPIALQAHVTGDVDLRLGIRQDGTVESAVAVSGPELLQRAALDSAQKSKFECGKCSGPANPVRLLYSFRLVSHSVGCNAPEDCNRSDRNLPGPQVSQLKNHVTVVNDVSGTCTCDGLEVKRRSAKCLYLWKCGL
jgi:hypothetical protein